MSTRQNSAALATLAATTRRAIFEHLCSAPHNVTDLAEKLPVSRSAVSQHLKVLQQEGLVHARREGRRRIYSAAPAALHEVVEYASALRSQAPVDDRRSSAQDSGASSDEVDQGDRIDRVFAQWPQGSFAQDANPVVLATRLLQTGRVMEKLLANSCARYGVSKVDAIILGTLSRLPAPHESAPTQLSKITVLSPPGVTKRLDHLERRKLIVRLTGSDDRRTQIVRLTDRGRDVSQHIMQAVRLHSYSPIHELAAEERSRLNRTLRRLLRELEAQLP